MAKADLLTWVRKHSPPLWAPTSDVPNVENPPWLTDYNRFNAVTNATEAKAALMARTPPLSMDDVNAGMAEYNK